ncbi:MAG: HAMP domain-containing histidine kinase [Planctomycetes bacterium]|nr:HAMP domain-containing histidine kinase [Planctomycetota bacterium]
MKRPWHIWTIFTVALAVVLSSLGWMTAQAVRLEQVERERERQETIALRQSELDGSIRQSLLQMDSLLAAELRQQSALPPLAYRAVYRDPWQGIALGSPLLLTDSPYTLLHFEIDADGQLSSPQVPPPEMWPHAALLGVSVERLEASRRNLDRMRAWVDHKQLLAALPREMISLPGMVALSESAPAERPASRDAASLTANSPAQVFDKSVTQADRQIELQANQALRAARGRKDYETRKFFFRNSVQQQRFVQGQYVPQAQLPTQTVSPQTLPRQSSAPPPGPSQTTAVLEPRANALAAAGLSPGNFDRINRIFDTATLGSIHEGESEPLWVDKALVFARRVKIGNDQYVQGCLLNWPAIKTRLLSEIADLLVGVDLEPIDVAAGLGNGDLGDGRVLAALPVRLVVPPIVEPPLAAVSIPVEIYIAWASVLLAAIAVAGLLVGVMTLSERRAAFVSAVTHELRTPLTTFRMYAEMLAEGMVRDEADQQHYLRTLQNEADRLTHLVENVLSYARVERGRPGGKSSDFRVASLLERIAERLEDQVARAGMILVVDDADASQRIIAHADASAVEQIVVNLVDNAAKYAAGCEDGRIHLHASIDAGAVAISVRDHGPGIDRKEARRLFRPFCKSAKDAAGTAPGVGLGLALSRRLASAMGGSLVLDAAAGDGACFVLRLPAG